MRVFQGFPRQWLPLFEWFGVDWKGSIAPHEYLPMFSDFSEGEIVSLIDLSRKRGALRSLVESTSVVDAVLSDCLYILDQDDELSAEMLGVEVADLSLGQRFSRRPLKLNSWQSYGRASVRAVEALASAVPMAAESALVLPCAFSRPYGESPTHRRVQKHLANAGIQVAGADRIVVTSLGVVPEALWSHPFVMAYDAGVPDIYRVLRLLRSFFAPRPYRMVFDALQYEPYSDVLRLIEREGSIKGVRRVGRFGARGRFVKATGAPKQSLLDAARTSPVF